MRKRPPVLAGGLFVRERRGWEQQGETQAPGVPRTRRVYAGSPQEATRTAEIGVTVAVGCFLRGLSQPAESQGSGIENSDQPQSIQTLTSGEGVMGGWLRVRGKFRYRRISAGTVATASE